MRLIDWLGCGALMLVLSGCARPQLFECRGSSCGQASTGAPGADAGATFSTGPGDASSPADAPDQSVALADLSMMAAPDLSASPAPADLASAAPADLAHPSCVGSGGSCYYHQNGVCCSNYCIYSNNTCR